MCTVGRIYRDLVEDLIKTFSPLIHDTNLTLKYLRGKQIGLGLFACLEFERISLERNA